MGWTTCSDASYWKSSAHGDVVDRRRECDRLFTWTSKDAEGNAVRRHSVLKSAMVGSTYYGAVETVNLSDGSRRVWAAVALTCGKGRDGTVWGYKDMDETMGPCSYKCPASILALLTPTDDAMANEWREKCRNAIVESKKKRELYAPSGVKIVVEGRSWIIASASYCASTGYRGCRFSKAKWHDSDYAVRVFLENYGTAAQKAEYAASGRECPKEWKGVAA